MGRKKALLWNGYWGHRDGTWCYSEARKAEPKVNLLEAGILRALYKSQQRTT